MLRQLLLKRRHALAPNQGDASHHGPSDINAPTPLWPISEQYASIVKVGRRRPQPSFGTPTLVWHLGIWQGIPLDQQRALRSGSTGSPRQRFRERRDDIVNSIDARNERFFREISNFLVSLQHHGRPQGSPIESLKFIVARSDEVAAERGSGWPHQFKVCQPQSLAFTLWWQDEACANQSNQRQDEPSVNDLRVRVHAQTYIEHATISFFIDASKPWNAAPVYRAADAQGVRRQTIFRHIECVRSICGRQIQNDYVEQSLRPERLDSEEDAKGLYDAAEYLYEEIWRAFLESFHIANSTQTPAHKLNLEGEVFANLRALVHSTDGLVTPAGMRRQSEAEALRRENHVSTSTAPWEPSSTTGIGRFATFDNDSGEPNTILKSYWPFVRRITPAADRRNFIGCGILDWRCLFVSALASLVADVVTDEADGTFRDVPFGWLPEGVEHHDAPDAPIRYLLLTKGEPHRQQIGRFVERINAVETMRLFSLKHWPTIYNAAALVRVLGRELDKVLERWSEQRVAIDEKYDRELQDGHSGALSPLVALRRLVTLAFLRKGTKPNKWDIEDPVIQRIKDARLVELNNLIHQTEAELISLGASLDDVGRGGAGRLLYAIDRAKYFIDEFMRMTPTLEIGNIDGWINYMQFVERGLKPNFDLVASTGVRHSALRTRLQWVSDMMQTSALIVETAATSRNTEILRKIATGWWWTKATVVGLAIAVAVNLIYTGALDAIVSWLKELLGSVRF